MKKIISLILATLLTLSLSVTVLAADTGVKFDTTNSSKGYVTVTYTGPLDKKIVIKVNAAKSKQTEYYYTIGNDPVNIPLNLGDKDDYTIVVMKNVQDKKYSPVDKATFTVDVKEKDARFLISNSKVNYTSKMVSVSEYGKTLTPIGDKKAKIDSIYNDIISKYVYDTPKAQSGLVNYEPTLDATYKDKKGICYDYSSLFAGVLRSQGIPARVVFGYTTATKDTFHAWNEIYYGDEWITVDTTADAIYKAGNAAYTMKKDVKDFKVSQSY